MYKNLLTVEFMLPSHQKRLITVLAIPFIIITEFICSYIDFIQWPY